MCRVLGVSPSGFYAWLKRAPSSRAVANELLLDRIREIHRDSRENYGALNILKELSETGWLVNHKRVARLMRLHGIVGVTRRKGFKTTRRDSDSRPAPDLVERTFVADGPDQLWVADITYIPTWAGFLYLAVVMDVFSRRIVGWCMEDHLRTDLVLEALNMAIWQRTPQRVIHHSDQGSQYTSLQFGKRCREVGVRPSMGSVGDCYDNAMCESFFATLECELLKKRRFRTKAEAKMAIFDYIEAAIETVEGDDVVVLSFHHHRQDPAHRDLAP
jgi:putative transposase